jgi:redox-regulated HSP33 family molecular chaperone
MSPPNYSPLTRNTTIRHAMKNWKTTTLGILTIAGALISAVTTFLKTGTIDLITTGPLITAGWAAIQAKDAS